ncbi:hypothetical protein Z043_114164, partial [Scleropages formosus]
IPKPVYGHKSCCLENQCPSGPSYRIHYRGSRIHPTTFDQELMSEYSPISLLQRKECEALMQRQILEHKQRLTLQEAQPEDYRTIEHSGPIKMPAFLEPNYRSFPHVDSSCSLLSPSVGQYHHLQFPSKVYHTLPVSSSGSYEEMQQMTLSHSDKLYTDHIPDGPKHTQRPLHPAFYYVQESLNVPNGAVYADIRGNHRHTVSSPVNKQSAADQYLVPHPASDETSSSCSISPSSHSCLNSYEVSAYQLHKMHLNSGQKRTFSDGPGFTLSIPHAEQVEDYSEKKSRVLPSSVGLCSQGFGSGAFHRVQPRFDHENFCHDSKPQCNLRESPKMDDRLTSPNGSVNHSITNRCQRETGGTDVQSSHSDPCSSLFTAENVTTLNNTNKVIINQSSNLKQIASENVQNRLENPKNEELYDKWVEGPDLPPSPPMPVIHSVFSLAPYKAYLEATGMLPAQNMLGGEQELRAWLDKTGLGLCASSQDKSQSISSLLRAAVKDSWIRCNDTVAAFQQIISQLKDFVSSNKCPFPHVVRAGMVFVPMLVVKESLFPQVPGTSIDQLLQELKVELRPTTLSEERHFAKLQGHACSSKLRRLLSLKHLPDVYPDVLNLFYHVCASKRLDLENVKVKMEQDSSHLEQDGMGVPDSAWAPVMSDDFSTGSDTETERTYAVSCQSHCSTSTTLPNSQTHSGMILKLRKVLFNKGPVGSESIHPRTCKSGSCGPPVYTENRKAAGGRNYREITWKIHGQVAKRVKGGSSQGLRSTRSSSKAVRLCRSTKTLDLRKSTKALHLHRSMVHIKYCSYLSANHSKQRRRWVLRSAVRTARQAMKERYPELVGKRICHLYEEKDKSEVWYKGVVVRVHEPHPNPLKTVFEVKYDSEPEWQYYLELLMDYKKGWLKVED